jgi:predicted HAD superfamily hydrolase
MYQIDLELVNLIEKAIYVSFDIFDTAIIRQVLVPVDVFTLVARQYKTNNNVCLSNYRSKRIQAEKRARKKVWQEQQISEVSLTDIFNCLHEDCGWGIELSETLKNLEIEIETKICRRNPFIFDVYRYCLSQNKQIIFTSDMYLPLGAIASILEMAGYDKFEDIFLSSELKRTKHQGEIYPYIVDRLGCKPEQILHIGDNKRSDIIMAQKNGIATYYYEKPLTRALSDRKFKVEQFAKQIAKPKTLEESIYLATIVNKYYSHPQIQQSIKDENNFWYDLGFKSLGVLFLSFSNWLKQETKKNGIEKIFFLARDGYIMKRVYDRLSSIDDRAIPAEYLYASRRALNIPGIIELDNFALKFLLSGTSILTVSQYLERAGLQSDRYLERLQEEGLSDLNEKIIALSQFQKLKNFYQSIADDIEEIAAKEREKLAIYLNSLGFFARKKVAVVDIGWHGSMQYSLAGVVEALGKNLEIEGYYFGTKVGAEKFKQKGMTMYGYLCDCGRPNYYKNTIRLSTEIFEFIHSAPHGSVMGYSNEATEIKPVLEDNDRLESELAKVQLMHTGAMDFIEDYLTNFKTFSCLKIPGKDRAIQPLRRVLRYPSLLEAKRLGDIEHVESFGRVAQKRYIARPPKYKPLMLLRVDKMFIFFKSSFWKMGYIKRFFGEKPN